MRPTKRPGASTPSGSSAAFIRRMRGNAGGSGCQTAIRLRRARWPSLDHEMGAGGHRRRPRARRARAAARRIGRECEREHAARWVGLPRAAPVGDRAQRRPPASAGTRDGSAAQADDRARRGVAAKSRHARQPRASPSGRARERRIGARVAASHRRRRVVRRRRRDVSGRAAEAYDHRCSLRAARHRARTARSSARAPPIAAARASAPNAIAVAHVGSGEDENAFRLRQRPHLERRLGHTASVPSEPMKSFMRS